MFSANENITLRQDKRRIVGYIEETIPEEALDQGTSVMVMQMTCREPGCVPLETAIAIVFPRNVTEELIPGVRESGPNHGGGKGGGTFKTRIMMPLSQVTREDVLDALPPGFEGGRKTWESTCLALRDAMFGRMGQMFGNANDDFEVDQIGLEDNKLVAKYLIGCLNEYIDNGCKPPEYGKPFPDRTIEQDVEKLSLTDLEKNGEQRQTNDDSNKHTSAESDSTTENGTHTTNTIQSLDDNEKEKDDDAGNSSTNDTIRESTPNHSQPSSSTTTTTLNAMEWRRQQNMTQSIQLPTSSMGIIQKLAERDHAPGKSSV